MTKSNQIFVIIKKQYIFKTYFINVYFNHPQKNVTTLDLKTALSNRKDNTFKSNND